MASGATVFTMTDNGGVDASAFILIITLEQNIAHIIKQASNQKSKCNEPTS
jgi:hypothetical protein